MEDRTLYLYDPYRVAADANKEKCYTCEKEETYEFRKLNSDGKCKYKMSGQVRKIGKSGNSTYGIKIIR